MFKKLFISTITAMALTVLPTNYAAAGSGDALLGGLVGGVVGGVVGGAIVNNANKKATRRQTVRRSSYNTAQRQENRDVQTSLNYYNFPAGVPDGVFGRRTRNAISSYQVFMGYPASGHLTQFQKTVLLNSYNQSIVGGMNATQVVASSPYGTRGMLKHVQQGMVGGAETNGTASQQQTLANTTLGVSAFAVPTFGETSSVGSVVNHCNKINLITSTNGGYTNISNMKDPAFALNEQFCLARVYAISASEEMTSHVQGSNPEQIREQCETLGPIFKEQIAALSLGSREQVVTKTSNAILSIGMSPAQLIRTGKICLGVGYRIDNLDVVLASTLILVALGEPVYGELLGHHLLNGFGTARRTDLAMQWYASATDAIEQGQPAVFVPGLTDRTKLIQTAVAKIGEPTETTEQSQWFGITVPTFWSETTSEAAE